MEPSDQKRDYIVFMDAPKGPMSVLSIPPDETDSAVEARAIPRDPNPKKEILGPDKKIGDVAWLRVKFNDAPTARDAANIARNQNLVYIPYNIIAGIRQRVSDVSMQDIRKEFALRSAPPVSQPSVKGVDEVKAAFSALQDLVDAIAPNSKDTTDRLWGSYSDYTGMPRRPR